MINTSILITSIGLTLIPAVAAVIGGLLAETGRISDTIVGLSLHFAAGLIYGVIGVEIFPQILSTPFPFVLIIVFILGGITFIGLDIATDIVKQTLENNKIIGKLPVVFFIGTAFDFLTDGILIASGIGLGLGLVLAIASAITEIPQSFATLIVFKKRKIPINYRLLSTGLFFVLILMGAPLGAFLVVLGNSFTNIIILAFTSGFLSLLLTEEILPRAHKIEEARSGALAFILGFAMIALISDLISYF